MCASGDHFSQEAIHIPLLYISLPKYIAKNKDPFTLDGKFCCIFVLLFYSHVSSYYKLKGFYRLFNYVKLLLSAWVLYSGHFSVY